MVLCVTSSLKKEEQNMKKENLFEPSADSTPELSRVIDDQANRAALAEVADHFFLSSKSEGEFIRAIWREPGDDNIDQFVDFDKQHRAFFPVVTPVEATDAYKKYKNYVTIAVNFNSTVTDEVWQKYFPNGDLSVLFDPEVFTKKTVITNPGEPKQRKRKLFKFLINKNILTTEEVQAITTCIEPAEPMQLCLSRNPIDMLMISTGQSFSSCMDLDSSHEEAFYMGLPGFICDSNRILAFLTTGSVHDYYLRGELIRHYRYLERTWLIATPHGFFFGRSYPSNKRSQLYSAVKEILPILNKNTLTESPRSLYPIPDLAWEAGDWCMGYLDDLSLRGTRWFCGTADRVCTPFKHTDGFNNLPDYFEEACVGSRETCESCGAEVRGDEIYAADSGGVLCDACYYETYTRCEQCGNEIRNDDAIRVASEMYICSDCLSAYYTQCFECGGYKRDTDITTVSDMPYCQHCLDFRVDWFRCDACDEDFLGVPHKGCCESCADAKETANETT